MDVGPHRGHPAAWAVGRRTSLVSAVAPVRRRAAQVLLRSPGLVPTVAALAAAVVWAAHDGGLEPLDWPVPAMALVALAAVVLLAAGVPRPRGRWAAASLTAFAAFAAWNEASVAWAGDRGAAWEGANKTLVYGVAFAAAVWGAWAARSGLAVLAAFAVAVAVLGTVALVEAATGAGWHGAFVAGRFAAPMGYENADAALFLMAVWPLLAVSLRRGGAVLLRGAAIGGVVVLVELALLVQSRASVATLPLVLCVFAALAPRRLHLLLLIAIVSGATVLAAPRLLAVYPAVNDAADVPATIQRALWAVVATAVGAVCAGTLVAALDRRVAVPSRAARRIAVAVVAAAVVAVGAGAAIAVRAGAPEAVRTGWQQFTHDAPPAAGATHLSAGLGSNRYDFWRVALDAFRAHPVAGIGADNFAAAYARDRRSGEEPRFPHSVELRALAQTGAVGGLLLALALAVPLGSAFRRRAGEDVRAVRAAGVAVAGYWLVHGSVDWLWEFPALTVPALVALAIAARVGRAESAPRPDPPWHGLARAAIAAGSVAVIASVALPWLSARAVAVADATWGSDPQRAFAALRLAARVDPVSDEPYLTEAVIRSRLGDWEGMAGASRAALARRSDDWYADLELAVADVQLRRLPAARAALARARALDPREPAIELVARGIARPDSFDPFAVDGVFLARAAAVAAP
jgi:O-antigen ligase/polysaccharide polymerase Wzy-like membrane protein